MKQTLSLLWLGLGPLTINESSAQCVPGDLSAQLDDLMQSESIEGSQIGGIVSNVDTGETIWTHQADLPLNPASTQKLLTMLAVLDTVGPAHRMVTKVEADGEIVDGVLNGDLYIRGSGDPSLEYQRWWLLIRDTYVSGVQHVIGDLVIDNSLLPPTDIPGWSGGNDSFEGALYEAPISALNIHYNSVGMIVRPGAQAGDPVRSHLTTPTQAVTIKNKAKTTQRGKTSLQVTRKQKGAQTELILTGNMRQSAKPKGFNRSVAHPTDYAGITFRETFAEMGGIIEGELRTGETPPNTITLASTTSHSTGHLVREMTKYSNNQMAEQLATVAADHTYGRSNRYAVKRLLTDTLQAHGIDIQGAIILNASGLSRNGRLTARQLAQVTHALYTHPNWRYEAMAAMAIFGRDGTVGNRLKQSPARDSVRAKTGSLSGVATIAGAYSQ